MSADEGKERHHAYGRCSGGCEAAGSNAARGSGHNRNGALERMHKSREHLPYRLGGIRTRSTGLSKTTRYGLSTFVTRGESLGRLSSWSQLRWRRLSKLPLAA